MSEQSSSIRKGAGYEAVYLSRRKLEEDLTWSPEKESSTHPRVKGEEGCEEDEGKEGDKTEEGYDEEGGGDDDEEDESDKRNEEDNDGSVGRVDSCNTKPFILPSIWTIENFYPTMTRKFFNTLHDRHQILDNIPLHLLGKFKKCYSRKMASMGMYDAMYTAGLRLPLMELYRQLANYLSLSISQITPNAQRIFIGAEVIWGQSSGGNCQLMLNESFYCYKPQQISLSKGIYHFLSKKSSLKLVFDMPNSNRNWKNRYFFIIKVTEWGIVKESGESLVSFLCYFFGFNMYLTLCSPLFSTQVRPKIIDEQENFLRKVWEIPLEQRKWKDLVTLDTLHAFCEGPESMPTT